MNLIEADIERSAHRCDGGADHSEAKPYRLPNGMVFLLCAKCRVRHGALPVEAK